MTAQQCDTVCPLNIYRWGKTQHSKQRTTMEDIEYVFSWCNFQNNEKTLHKVTWRFKYDRIMFYPSLLLSNTELQCLNLGSDRYIWHPNQRGTKKWDSISRLFGDLSLFLSKETPQNACCVETKWTELLGENGADENPENHGLLTEICGCHQMRLICISKSVTLVWNCIYCKDIHWYQNTWTAVFSSSFYYLLLAQ